MRYNIPGRPRRSQEFMIPLGSPEKTSVWDEEVPIIQSGRTTEIFLSDQINYPDAYNELCYTLDQAYEGDTIIMHINTPGGNVDSAFKIIGAMKSCKGHITGKLSGTVASAGTIITMFCDELIVEDYTQFMIHNYSTGTQGKGNELKTWMDFNDKEIKVAFADIYSGFLTKSEMTDVMKDQDIWLNKSEVLARWAKKVGTDVTPKPKGS